MLWEEEGGGPRRGGKGGAEGRELGGVQGRGAGRGGGRKEGGEGGVEVATKTWLITEENTSQNRFNWFNC